MCSLHLKHSRMHMDRNHRYYTQHHELDAELLRLCADSMPLVSKRTGDTGYRDRRSTEGQQGMYIRHKVCKLNARCVNCLNHDVGVAYT